MQMQRDVDYLSIGKRVRERREEMDLTQRDLADAIDVSGSFIGYIERAEKVPSLETVALLSQALGVSLDRLVFGINTRCERKDCPLYGELEALLRTYGIGIDHRETVFRD